MRELTLREIDVEVALAKGWRWFEINVDQSPKCAYLCSQGYVNRVDYYTPVVDYRRGSYKEVCVDVPAYTTSWAEAGPLLEEMRAQCGEHISLGSGMVMGDGVVIPWYFGMENTEITVGPCETAPLAIVLAWLWWKTGERVGVKDGGE